MADALKLHDLEFVPFISEKELEKVLRELGERINTSYEDKCPLFVVVLNGAFIFAADLLKHVSVNCEVSFLRLSSYRGTSSTGDVKETMPLGTDVSDRDVIIVEDIIDTGRTMARMKEDLLAEGAASVAICTLLFKPDAFREDYRIDMIGLEIPDRFVVGYGLDYDGLGRNMPSIYQVRPKEQ